MCWLDASDASVITIDGNVSQWLDKSGNGRHCGTTSAGSRPSILSASLNGLNVINFSSGKRLTFDENMMSRKGLDVFIVSYPTAITPDSRIGYGNMVIGDSPDTGSQCIVIGFRIGKFATYAEGVSTKYESRALNINPLNTWSICEGYSNNTQTGSRINAGNLSTAQGTRINLSIRALAVYGYATSYLGRLAEIIVFDGILALDQRNDLEGYLAWKWGLQALLPSNHKWKTLAPTVPNWEGLAVFSDGSIARTVHITSAATGQLLATATPDQATGAFSVAQVGLGRFVVTIYRDGYRPLTHGPIEPIL